MMARLRIRTVRDPRFRQRGQDVVVSVVNNDGPEEMLTGVKAARCWWVDGRREYVMTQLEVVGAEFDVVAEIAEKPGLDVSGDLPIRRRLGDKSQ